MKKAAWQHLLTVVPGVIVQQAFTSARSMEANLKLHVDLMPGVLPTLPVAEKEQLRANGCNLHD